jgi:hypothetical protein
VEDGVKKLGQTLPPKASSQSAVTSGPKIFDAKKSKTPCQTGQTGRRANFSMFAMRRCDGCFFSAVATAESLSPN